MSEVGTGVASGAASGAAFGPWGALAGAVLGGILGSRQNKEQEKARKEQALINMYAPLFGKAPQALGMRQDFTTSGALSGLMSGYQLGHQLGRPTPAAPKIAGDPFYVQSAPVMNENLYSPDPILRNQNQIVIG